MRHLKLPSMICAMLSLISFSNFAQTTTPPNIVVIVADDLGYADTYWKINELGGPNGYVASESDADGGETGYVAQATTNLRQLAEENWFFNNAYISGNTCAPTRSGLLSGRYQQNFGVYSSGDGGLGIPNSVLTIPANLGSAYDKMCIGKWHLGIVENEHSPVARGFDHFFGYFGRGGHDYWAMTDEEYNVNGDGTGQYIESNGTWYYTNADAVAANVNFSQVNNNDGDPGFTYDGDSNNMMYQYNGNTNAGFYNVIDEDYTQGDFLIPSHGGVYHSDENTQPSQHLTNRTGGVYMSELLTNQALRYIDNKPLRQGSDRNDPLPRDENKPFFLYLAYTAVHTDNTVPRSWYQEWRDKVLEGADEDGTIPNWDRNQRASLIAMLDNMDDGIGEIVQLLKDKGEWDNTVFIFLSDNGGANGMIADSGPLRASKQYNFEGGIRTPFIFSWPAQHPTSNVGRVVDTPISSLDIFPTLVEAAGTTDPGNLDGKSILSLLTEKSNRTIEEGKRERYMHFTEGSLNLQSGTKNNEFAIIDTQENKKVYGRVIADRDNKSSFSTTGRGEIALWLFDMDLAKDDPNYSGTEGFESNQADILRNDNSPYHTNDDLMRMLTAFEEWIAPKPNPTNTNNAKAFYPIINPNTFPEDQDVILRVYNDIYYAGTATSYTQNDINAGIPDFAVGDVRSIVVQIGYVATLTDFSGNTMRVNGTGKPLLLNGFNGNVKTITIGDGYSSCSGTMTINDGGTSDSNNQILVDGLYDTSNVWLGNNRDIPPTVTFTFCEDLTFDGITMYYRTRANVAQYANVNLAGSGGNQQIYTGYDTTNGIYKPSSETVSGLYLDTGEHTTNRVRIEMFSHNKARNDAEHAQNNTPELLEVQFHWSQETLSNDIITTDDKNLKIWNSKGYLNVSYPDIIIKLEIISLTGLNIFTYHNADSSILNINKSNLSSGLYLVKVKTINNQVMVKKVFID